MPRKIFSWRDAYPIWQLILAFLFINALMLMPISVRMQSLETVSLQDYFPKAMALLDNKVLSSLQDLEVDEASGKLQIQASQEISTKGDAVVTFDENSLDQASKSLEGKTGVVFTPEGFVLAESQLPSIQQTYKNPLTIVEATSVQSLQETLSQQWFQDNRMAVIMSRILNVCFLLTVSNLIFVLGSAGFLSLMKHYRKFDIANYTEAVAIALMCLGLPTLIAVALGFWRLNPLDMMTVQGLGFVVMLIGTFWVTHFNDDFNKRGA